MSLVNLQTNLKSLKFGKDRPGLGDSGQPYVVTPIPGTNDPIPGSDLDSEDFLLRGGINTPRDTVKDLERLGKFFIDSNVKGVLFSTKQNLLSRIANRTQASGVGLNEGVYTPLNTLAQAGINAIGGHIPKQGLVPFRGPNTYLNTLKERSDNDFKIIGDEEGFGNRLVDLTELKINESISINPKFLKQNQISDIPSEILAYGGGPNSIIGVGKTRLTIGTDPKGNPLTTGKGNVKLYNGNIGFSSGIQIPEQNKPYIKFKNPTYTDFRKEKLKDANGVSTIMSLAPSYDPAKKKTIDGPKSSRINYTSPGQRGNIIDYSQGKLDSDGSPMGPVDRINALPIYRSSLPGLNNSIAENDLIKFRIGAISTKNPKFRDYVNFRAFIDSFSDSYNASWNPQKYMGRGENFYKYDSFTRDINLSFTVAAQSKEEIMIMYRKLNYLVSNLTPEYTDDGYMAGPLVQLTMGAWCYELPGFIKSITLDVPQESSWEIGIPNLDKDSESVGGITYRDPKVKEMPHICRVTGFVFTPIHKFRPAKQELNGGEGAMNQNIAATLKDENVYGDERYISLANGVNSENIDYDSYNTTT